jgi:preprotein translocase subunit SecE
LTKKIQPQIVAKKKSRFAFVTDIIGELRKVNWPSRRDTVRLTLMVLAVCIAVGLFLGALDYGFSELVSRLILGGS